MGGWNTLVWVVILNQTLMIIKSKHVPLFTISHCCLYCQMVTKACVDSPSHSCFLGKKTQQNQKTKLRLPLHCWPACQFQSTADSQGASECTASFLFQSDSMFIIYSRDHHFHAVFPLSRGKWMSGNKWGSSQQLHINQAASMWCRGWH